MKWLADILRGIADSIAPKQTLELPSPRIRINEAQARKIGELIKTVPGFENCILAAIAPSNSMEPSIDDGMHVILDPSIPHTGLVNGDIIYYEAPGFKAIHRIKLIGLDSDGWHCICQGDNNGYPDPVIVRPEHIRGTWRMTLN